MNESKKNIIKNDDYNAFVKQIKSRIQSSQIKAAISVNQEMLKLYWFLFWRISPQVVDDLNNEIRQQLVAQLENGVISAIFQITWGHNREIITKIRKSEEALFYVNKPIGVSEYELTRHLPEKYKNALPTIEEIEKEIGGEQ